MAGPARLVPRFARDAFAPGDTVDGVLVVREPMDGVRRLDAHLRYVDRSPDFAGAVTYDTLEPLYEGPVEVGQEIPFAFRLPPDALPAWESEATNGYGTLSWAIVVEADIAAGLDKTITHAVPVSDDAAAWRGPEPPAPGSIKESGGGWDVTIAPDRWSPRRGETVSVAVEIGKPDAGRDSMKIGLMCQADFKVEYETRDAQGDHDRRREWRHATLLEEWPPLDPAAPHQIVEFALPKDGPFTYDGDAFGFRWFVVAKEAKRLRSDPHRSARLHVLP